MKKIKCSLFNCKNAKNVIFNLIMFFQSLVSATYFLYLYIPQSRNLFDTLLILFIYLFQNSL